MYATQGAVEDGEEAGDEEEDEDSSSRPKKPRPLICAHGCGARFRKLERAMDHEREGICLLRLGLEQQRERALASRGGPGAGGVEMLAAAVRVGIRM